MQKMIEVNSYDDEQINKLCDGKLYLTKHYLSLISYYYLIDIIYFIDGIIENSGNTSHQNYIEDSIEKQQFRQRRSTFIFTNSN